MWHDIWHEEEIHEIMEKVIKWMLGRVEIDKQQGKRKKIIHQEEKEVDNWVILKPNISKEIFK